MAFTYTEGRFVVGQALRFRPQNLANVGYNIPVTLAPGGQCLMRLSHRFAVAVSATLALGLGGRQSLAQKSGGILRMPDFASPASMSIHEEVTRAAVTALMPVFNNLVLFDQHQERNTIDTIVPDLDPGHQELIHGPGIRLFASAIPGKVREGGIARCAGRGRQRVPWRGAVASRPTADPGDPLLISCPQSRPLRQGEPWRREAIPLTNQTNCSDEPCIGIVSTSFRKTP
jgi:hypothetical protein